MNRPVDRNPKTIYGQAKPGVHAIPPVALLHLGRGMEDGEAKYGLTNWRENEVSASVYYDAAFRHMAAWWDGEQIAPDSGVHHLGHVMACCAILLDAEHMGKLNDDRPSVPGTFADVVKAMTRPMGERAVRAPEAMTAPYGEEQPDIQTPRDPDVSQGIVSKPEVRSRARVECREMASIKPLPAPRAEEITAYIQGLTAQMARAFVAPAEMLGQPEDEDFGKALGEPVDWDAEDKTTLQVGFDRGEKAARCVIGTCLSRRYIAVEVRDDIMPSDLDATIREFLKGDRGGVCLAAFLSFRSHIGSQNHPSYSQSNRTRLAFYLDSRLAGVSATGRQMDEALRAAGLEFGSA
jgi:hypothetical protein